MVGKAVEFLKSTAVRTLGVLTMATQALAWPFARDTSSEQDINYIKKADPDMPKPPYYDSYYENTPLTATIQNYAETLIVAAGDHSANVGEHDVGGHMADYFDFSKLVEVFRASLGNYTLDTPVDYAAEPCLVKDTRYKDEGIAFMSQMFGLPNCTLYEENYNNMVDESYDKAREMNHEELWQMLAVTVGAAAAVALIYKIISWAVIAGQNNERGGTLTPLITSPNNLLTNEVKEYQRMMEKSGKSVTGLLDIKGTSDEWNCPIHFGPMEVPVCIAGFNPINNTYDLKSLINVQAMVNGKRRHPLQGGEYSLSQIQPHPEVHAALLKFIAAKEAEEKETAARTAGAVINN